MRKDFFTALALLVALFTMAIVFVNTETVEAAVQHNPPGAWQVTGKGASGSVGDTVPMEFSITAVLDRCVDVDVYIQTVDEARQKVSFVGAAVPARGASVSPERVDWPPAEFENGVARKYRVNARIDRGAVGEEIDGFYIYVWCPGISIFRGVVDDSTIKVVAKKQESSQKPTPVPTLSLIKTPRSAEPLPAAGAAPASIAAPNSAPANPMNPGSGLSSSREAVTSDTHPAGDGPTSSTPPSLPTVQPQSATLSPQQSLLSRIVASIREGFRILGRWSAELF